MLKINGRACIFMIKGCHKLGLQCYMYRARIPLQGELASFRQKLVNETNGSDVKRL